MDQTSINTAILFSLFLTLSISGETSSATITEDFFSIFTEH